MIFVIILHSSTTRLQLCKARKGLDAWHWRHWRSSTQTWALTPSQSLEDKTSNTWPQTAILWVCCCHCNVWFPAKQSHTYHLHRPTCYVRMLNEHIQYTEKEYSWMYPTTGWHPGLNLATFPIWTFTEASSPHSTQPLLTWQRVCTASITTVLLHPTPALVQLFIQLEAEEYTAAWSSVIYLHPTTTSGQSFSRAYMLSPFVLLLLGDDVGASNTVQEARGPQAAPEQVTTPCCQSQEGRNGAVTKRFN